MCVCVRARVCVCVCVCVRVCVCVCVCVSTVSDINAHKFIIACEHSYCHTLYLLIYLRDS